MDDVWHVIPLDDDLEHFDSGLTCWCGPTLEEVERDDGGVGYVITHHPLDGRSED
jgi:hypothetical protein